MTYKARAVQMYVPLLKLCWHYTVLVLKKQAFIVNLTNGKIYQIKQLLFVFNEIKLFISSESFFAAFSPK